MLANGSLWMSPATSSITSVAMSILVVGESEGRIAPVMHRTGLIDRVGSGDAGDQACAAAEREIFETPLNENDDAALKLNYIDQVDEEPHQPGEQPRDMDSKDICHRGGAADYRHFAFVEVMKWRRFFLPGHPRTDNFGGVRSALHRDLCDAGQWSSLFIGGVSKIANDENFGKIGDSQVAIHLDPAAAIRFRLGALGEFPPEGRGGDATGPEHRLCRQCLTRIPVFKRDARCIDIRYHHAFDHFHAQACD